MEMLKRIKACSEKQIICMLSENNPHLLQSVDSRLFRYTIQTEKDSFNYWLIATYKFHFYLIISEMHKLLTYDGSKVYEVGQSNKNSGFR